MQGAFSEVSDFSQPESRRSITGNNDRQWLRSRLPAAAAECVFA
jgi:hypothetical protein